MVVIKQNNSEDKTKAVITGLDEIELAIQMVKVDEGSDCLINKSYKEVSNLINKKYGLNSTEEDVFLVYEPTIQELEEDLRVQFQALGLMY